MSSPSAGRFDSLLVFVLGSACLMFALGQSPLGGTEGHRIFTAHQMLTEKHHWLVPTLFGQTYLKKPPMFYWVLAAFEKVFGPGEFVWRLPSVFSTAATAALICRFTAKWFDRSAGWVAGFACLGLIAIWADTRTADIDAFNSLSANLAALCILNLSLKPQPLSSRLFTTLLASVGCALAFLTKGPAGLPLIIGAMLGPAIGLRSTRPLKQPWSYAAFLLGVAAFAVWAGAMLHFYGWAPLQADSGGVMEARNRMLLNSWSQLLAVLSLPFVLLAYGFPVSLSLVLPLTRDGDGKFDEAQRRLLKSIVGTLVVAFVLQIISGMKNARYAYPLLPLFCPLAGAVAYGWSHGLLPERFKSIGRTWLLSVCLLYAGAAMCFIVGAKPGQATIGVVVVFGVALCVAAIMAQRAHRFVAIMACAAILFAEICYGLLQNRQHGDRSARPQGEQLARLATGPAPLVTWGTAWSQPELFYYGKLTPTMIHFTTTLPVGDYWLLLDPNEKALLQKKSPGLLKTLGPYQTISPYKHEYFLYWHAAGLK